MLSILLLVFDPVWAEKLLAFLIMLCMALGFRYAAKPNTLEMSWSVFLVFPLLHHFCFYIGFQSFSLGLGLMLFSLAYYLQMGSNRNSVKSNIALSALLLLTACSHLVPLLFFLIIWSISEIQRWWFERRIRPGRFLAVIPATLLSMGFVLMQRGDSMWEWPNFTDQLHAFFDFQALIPHHLHEQRLPVLGYVTIMVFLAGYVLYARKKGSQHALWIASLFLLVCYFVVPSHFASGGFIGIRLLLGMYILWALWLSHFEVGAVASAFLVAGVLVVNAFQVEYNLRQAQYHSTYGLAMRECAEHIPDGAVLVPLNYATHWMHYNVGLYASAFGTAVNLDNYEAYEPHFPVKWREGMAPGSRLGDFGSSRNPPFALEPFESETGKRVEVVVRCFYSELGASDSITWATEALLERHFEQGVAGEGYELWMRKQE